jgi:hypothetical protein
MELSVGTWLVIVRQTTQPFITAAFRLPFSALNAEVLGRSIIEGGLARPFLTRQSLISPAEQAPGAGLCIFLHIPSLRPGFLRVRVYV